MAEFRTTAEETPMRTLTKAIVVLIAACAALAMLAAPAGAKMDITSFSTSSSDTQAGGSP